VPNLRGTEQKNPGIQVDAKLNTAHNDTAAICATLNMAYSNL